MVICTQYPLGLGLASNAVTDGLQVPSHGVNPEHHIREFIRQVQILSSIHVEVGVAYSRIGALQKIRAAAHRCGYRALELQSKRLKMS